jgi:hypothetical protein
VRRRRCWRSASASTWHEPDRERNRAWLLGEALRARRSPDEPHPLAHRGVRRAGRARLRAGGAGSAASRSGAAREDLASAALEDDTVVEEPDLVGDLARKAHLARRDEHRQPPRMSSSTSPTSSGPCALVTASSRSARPARQGSHGRQALRADRPEHDGVRRLRLPTTLTRAPRARELRREAMDRGGDRLYGPWRLTRTTRLRGSELGERRCPTASARSSRVLA